MQVFLACRMVGEADKAGLAELGDMQVMHRIGATHEQLVFGAGGPDHAEIEQKLFLLIEIGRAQPTPCNILDFGDSHWGFLHLMLGLEDTPLGQTELEPQPRSESRHRRSPALSSSARRCRSSAPRKAAKPTLLPWEDSSRRPRPASFSSRLTRSQAGSNVQRPSTPREPTRSTSRLRCVSRRVSR